MNTGVIDRFTEVFTRYIDSGFGLVGGKVAFLASTLIVLDVTIAGLFWAWGADEDVLAHPRNAHVMPGIRPASSSARNA